MQQFFAEAFKGFRVNTAVQPIANETPVKRKKADDKIQKNIKVKNNEGLVNAESSTMNSSPGSIKAVATTSSPILNEELDLNEEDSIKKTVKNGKVIGKKTSSRKKKETKTQSSDPINAAGNSSSTLNEKLDLNEDRPIKKMERKKKITLKSRINFKNRYDPIIGEDKKIFKKKDEASGKWVSCNRGDIGARADTSFERYIRTGHSFHPRNEQSVEETAVTDAASVWERNSELLRLKVYKINFTHI